MIYFVCFKIKIYSLWKIIPTPCTWCFMILCSDETTASLILFWNWSQNKTKKKNERQLFGNKKRIPNFHIPEILLNLKTTWMIARVPNKISTHKRATETNFVVEAMSSGFSAPRMSLSFLLSSTLGFSRTGSWEFMWAVRSVTLCILTFCHVEKIHWVLE